MNGNGFLDLCAHRWGQSSPLLQQKRPEINPELFRPHSEDTSEEVMDTEEEDNDGSGETIDLSDWQEYVRDELEVLATCMRMKPRFQAWTLLSWKRHV